MDFKAPASSGSSNVGPVSSSNAYYSATIPANARVKLIARLKPYIFHIRTKPRNDSYFSVRVRPRRSHPRFSFKSKDWATLEVQERGSNKRHTLTIRPERDRKEITVRFETKSTVTPVDSSYSRKDESVVCLEFE